jgi:hypothetical protein
MKAFEIWTNGKKVAVAGLDEGVVTVTFTIRNQVDPIWLEARGRDQTTGTHAKWLHSSLRVGDEFQIKLIDTR